MIKKKLFGYHSKAAV